MSIYTRTLIPLGSPFNYRVHQVSFDKETHPHLHLVKKSYRTNCGKYYILEDEVVVNGDPWKHLRVSRTDNKPIHNYMDLLQIKHDLIGGDKVAIEVYPKKSEFVNGSNTYHLWSPVDDALIVPNLIKLYKYL